MSQAVTDPHARECDVFCRYLTGHSPSAYLEDRYRRGNGSFSSTCRRDAVVDRALLVFARAGVLAVALADAYAAKFRRETPLRCKLILMLALVEHDGRLHGTVDRPVAATRARVLVRLALTGLAWAARLGLAVILFGPVQLVSRLLERSAARG